MNSDIAPPYWLSNLTIDGDIMRPVEDAADEVQAQTSSTEPGASDPGSPDPGV